jgi:diguanylate cyclase (GGDEF)-like protein
VTRYGSDRPVKKCELMALATRADPVPPALQRPASALDTVTIWSLQRFSVTIGCVAALLGGLVLIGGWAFDIVSLRSVLPGLGTMKANTALGIATLGGGLALIAGGKSARIAAAALAALALAIGVLTLVEYAFDRSLGIDELVFRDKPTPLAAHPGRPAVATALMLALLGAALLAGRRPAFDLVRTTGALAASLIAWASLSVYVFGQQALREVATFDSVALHTAAAMLLLAVGVLSVDPISWPVRMAFAKGTAGTICRWLLPPAILAPPLLGWLLRHADSGAYPEPFGWALYSVASSLGSVSLILLLAHRIALIDAERNLATELSLRDPLTGLANRRAFDSFLLESFNLARRHRHPLSLAMLDIDHFKSYNDDYGHPAGDELLKLLAGLLSSIARETDLVARVGGEEFAIALPETDLAGARVIAERMRAEMERSGLFRRTVTVSIGVAAMTNETTDTSKLVAACDEALYRAKGAGRNNVSVRGELAPARAGA